MMEIQLQLILTACIVNLMLTYVQLHNQLTHQAVSRKLHDNNGIHENYQNLNLFDSIATKDKHKSESYREILKQEVAKKKQAFHTMKKELEITQNKNAHKKRNYIDKMNFNEEIEAKREINSSEFTETIAWIDITNDPREDIDELSIEQTKPWIQKYGSTVDYQSIQAAKEKKDKSVNQFYRGIVERSINLFWGQQEQVLEIKKRERPIQKKTKTSIRPFFNFILETEDFIRRQLDLLGDKFWNPRYDFPPPMKVESVRQFGDIWNKMENFVNNDFQNLTGIENECDEIRDCIKKAREELSVRYEDIERLIRILFEMKQDLRNYTTTTDGTTAKEWYLSLKSLRRNDTRKAG